MFRGLVNGTPTDTISFMDRGLSYGDGLFETIRVVDKKPVLLDLHLCRLFNGLERLQIKAGFDEKLLHDEMSLLISNSQVTDVIVKIIVTRGESGRGYAPVSSASATRILQIFPTPDADMNDYRDGIQVKILSTRLGLNPDFGGIKHLNRLEQVIASTELGETFKEGIMLDINGQVRDGTRSNIFYMKGHELLTPDVDIAGVAGVMREYLLASMSYLNMTCRVVNECDPQDLYESRELFFCNSIYGIWPVREIVSKNGNVQYAEQKTSRKLQQLISTRLGLVQ